MKKLNKAIASILVFVMLAGVIPAYARAELISADYIVLVEPTYDYSFISVGRGNTALVKNAIYQETASGRALSKAEAENMENGTVSESYEYFLIEVDNNGFKKITDNYEDMSGPYANGLYYAVKNGKWGVINTRGETVFDFMYENPYQYPEEYPDERTYFLWITEEEQMIMKSPKNTDGFVIVDLKNGKEYKVDTDYYRGDTVYNNGLTLTVIGDNNFGYKDIEGNLVIRGPFYSADMFTNGYAVVGLQSNGKKWREVIDATGSVVFSDADKDYEIDAFSSCVSQEGFVYCSLGNTRFAFVNIYDGHVIPIDNELKPVANAAFPHYAWESWENGYCMLRPHALAERGYHPVMDSQGNILDFDNYTCLGISDTGVAWIIDRNDKENYKLEGHLGALQLKNSTVESAPAQPVTLETAVKYVPYSQKIGSGSAGYTLTSGNLPAGLALSPEGVLSGKPTELGVFSFTVTDGGGTQYACTLSVLWYGGVDVEQYNEPGYGFVETDTDDGRLHDLYITDRSQLKPEKMHLEGPYSEFYALYIDGKLLTRDVDYTAEEGSSLLTLNTQAQENAGGGTHLIDVEFHSETTGIHHTVQTVKFSGPALPGSEVTVRVQGIPVIWTDGEPLINADSRTMVPLRAIADAMGLAVDWNANTREATFSGGGKAIIFPLDDPAARTIEGGTVSMDTAAMAQNGRTFAPVRYLAEYFGYIVDWEGFSRTVDIKQ